MNDNGLLAFIGVVLYGMSYDPTSPQLHVECRFFYIVAMMG